MNPAGARYDPIGPPGMPVSLLSESCCCSQPPVYSQCLYHLHDSQVIAVQGFNPDDFQTGRRPFHPDLAQPGPGRGTDWDSMFG